MTCAFRVEFSRAAMVFFFALGLNCFVVTTVTFSCACGAPGSPSSMSIFDPSGAITARCGATTMVPVPVTVPSTKPRLTRAAVASSSVLPRSTDEERIWLLIELALPSSSIATIEKTRMSAGSNEPRLTESSPGASDCVAFPLT